MNDNRNERDNRLDGLLDSALAQYGAAEPLHGLEDRVLGRLHDGRVEDANRRAWWMWGGIAATALAAVVVAAVLLAPKAEQKPVQPSAQKQGEQVAPKQEAAVVASPRTPAMPKQPVPTPRLASAPRAPGLAPRDQGVPPVRPDVAMSGPRRAVFPTPTPPTDQEILLARYMRVTPREEVLAQINRKPLEFHEDPLAAPVGGSGASPHKAEGTK